MFWPFWKNRHHPVDGISKTDHSKVLSLKYKESFTIVLDREKFKHFFKNQFHWIGLAFLVLISLIIFSYGHFTKSQITIFYPNACLGGWINSHNAEGPPQVINGEGFNTDNSAYLNNLISQIYCGDFQGELPSDTNPKKIMLKFSWGIESKEATSTSDLEKESIDSTDDFSHSDINIENSSSTSENPPETFQQDISTESPPTENPAPAETPAVEPPADPPAEVPSPPADSPPETVSFLDNWVKNAYLKAEALGNLILPPKSLFKVLYTLDGTHWQTLGTISEDDIGKKEFEIPADNIYDKEDLSKIQINIQSENILDENLSVYLDSMWLEVEYEKINPDLENQNATTTPGIEAFKDQRKTFRADENPEFKVDLNNLEKAKSTTLTAPPKETFVEKFLSFWVKKKALAASEDPGISSVDILDTNGKDQNLETAVTDDNQTATIVIERPKGSLQPGKYTVRMNVETADGPVSTEDEFSWGVLAVNTDKSVYLPNEEVYLQIASLNEAGHTVCDSNLTLKISDPDGQITTLNTEKGSISQNDTCGPDNVTDQPDYSTHFTPTSVGTYSMVLINEENGEYINDAFYVQSKLPFNIKRLGATRINPFKSDYQMTLEVSANTAFSGKINEYIPSSFTVASSTGGAEIDTVNRDEKFFKQISWNVDIPKGSTTTLSYVYHAPEISPAVFNLGKAEMISYASSSAPQKVFAEKRTWQLASDAQCTFNGTGSVNWSTRTWTGCTGGGAPQAGDTVLIITNQTLVFDGGTVSIAGVILGTSTAANGLTINTANTLNLSGALSFTPNATANAKTVTLNGTATLTAASISMPAPSSTGAEKITCAASATSTLSVSGDISITGNSSSATGIASIDFATVSTACNLTAGSVTLTSGTKNAALVKMGTGTFTLNGALTFAGSTAGNAQLNMAVTGGKVSLNGGTLPAVGTTGAYTFTSVTNLDSAGTSSVAYATAVATWGTIHVSSGTLTMSAAAETATAITIDSGATLDMGTRLLTDSGAGASAFVCNGIFTGSGGITLTGLSAQLSGTCSATNTGSFTINGTVAPQFVTASNYTISGVIALGSGALVTNNGTVNQITSTSGMTGGGVTTKWTNATSSTLKINGPILATGILTANASPNTITYKNTATLKASSAHYNNVEVDSGANTVTAVADTIDGTVAVTTGTFDTGTVALVVTGTTTASGGTFKISSATGSKTLGHLVIGSSGTFSCPTAAELVTINGNLQVDGTWTNSAACTFTFAKSGGGGTLTGTQTSVSLDTATFSTTYSNSIATLTLTGTASINDDFTNNSAGTISASTLTVANTKTFTNNGTVSISTSLTGFGGFTNGSNSTLNINFTGSMTISTLTASASPNTVNFGFAGTQNIPAITYHHLTLSTSGGKTALGDLTVNGDFTMSGSVAFIGGTSRTHTFAGNWMVNTSTTTPFTFTTASTINFNTPGTPAGTSISGSSAAVLAFNIVNINNTSGFSTEASTLSFSASGNLTIASNVTFTPAPTGIISGTGTLTGNGTVKVTRTASTPDFSSQYTISNKTLTNLTVNYAGTAAQTISSTTYGNLLVSNTSATTTLGGIATTTGNFTANSSSIVDTSSYNMIVGGNWSNSGNFLAQSNTVTMNASSGTSTVTTGAKVFYNFTTNGAAVFELQDAMTVNNNLSITTGTLDAKAGSNYPITVKGNWSNAGTFRPESGRVSFLGTGAQTINNNNTWFQLNIDATSSRSVSFQSSVTQTILATGALTFTGRSGQLLTLSPLTASTTWQLAVSTAIVTQNITYVTPSYSDASGSAGFNQVINASDSSNLDGGNNTNWNLPALVSCSTSATSTAFGALDISSIKTSSPNITATTSCTSATGCTLYIHDQGDGGLQPGLYSTSATGTALILSIDGQKLSAGQEGYGVQAATSSAGSGANLTLNFLYFRTANNVGGLTLLDSALASTSASFTTREVIMTHKAAVAVTTKAGSYNDTITYSCTAN